MPEFRVTFPKPANGEPFPVEVGPITPDLVSHVGEKTGVVVTRCKNDSFCRENGLFVGDIVTDINTRPTTDQATFETAVANIPQTVMLTVRRPALRMTTARLLKIKYVGGTATDGSPEEQLDVRVIDSTLPFDDKIEESRTQHTVVTLTPEQLESLGKEWSKLPPRQPLRWAAGKHRFVAQSAFDESLASDRTLTNARYALIMDLKGNPVKGGGGQVIDVYGIESVDTKQMSGSYVSVTIANAPFPINIEFKGRFVMHKIADWSDADDKLRAERDAQKPKEDLDKYKTLPDVPAPAKPAQ